MPDIYLLDTSALLTLTDREPGVDRVRDLLKAAKRGEVHLHACFITLAEAQYILTYDLGADRARRLAASIRKFPVRWLHSDEALCASAAEFKAQHRISLADAFIAASAQRLGAVLVHKDPELAALGNLVQQELLPFKGAKVPRGAA
jgi:ribonuclease VapC